MEFIEAIKLTKQILCYINLNNFNIQKIANYEIKHYNYINVNIKRKNIINIGLKELEKNNYKYLDLKKIIKSYYDKRTRIKKRINKMNKENIWFITYTINDNNMNKNHTRKLKEILKNKNYIINEDYGKQTKRLHYHAIVESIEEPKKWEYGFTKIEKIKNYNTEAITKYITKLTNHTIKNTATKIIYSRNVK